jgi:hypothetical protein
MQTLLSRACKRGRAAICAHAPTLNVILPFHPTPQVLLHPIIRDQPHSFGAVVRRGDTGQNRHPTIRDSTYFRVTLKVVTPYRRSVAKNGRCVCVFREYVPPSPYRAW